jgi:hypothetical protein
MRQLSFEVYHTPFTERDFDADDDLAGSRVHHRDWTAFPGAGGGRQRQRLRAWSCSTMQRETVPGEKAELTYDSQPGWAESLCTLN